MKAILQTLPLNLEGRDTSFSTSRGETVGIPGLKLLLLPGPGLEPGSSQTYIAQMCFACPAAYSLS